MSAPSGITASASATTPDGVTVVVTVTVPAGGYVGEWPAPLDVAHEKAREIATTLPQKPPF